MTPDQKDQSRLTYLKAHPDLLERVDAGIREEANCPLQRARNLVADAVAYGRFPSGRTPDEFRSGECDAGTLVQDALSLTRKQPEADEDWRPGPAAYERVYSRLPNGGTYGPAKVDELIWSKVTAWRPHRPERTETGA